MRLSPEIRLALESTTADVLISRVTNALTRGFDNNDARSHDPIVRGQTGIYLRERIGRFMSRDLLAQFNCVVVLTNITEAERCKLS